MLSDGTLQIRIALITHEYLEQDIASLGYFLILTIEFSFSLYLLTKE